MTSIEERMQAMEDRNSIVELTGRYCHMARTRNVEGIVDLFCEDGVMEAAGTVGKGHAELLPMYTAAFKDLGPMPCVHNHTVEIDGDTATAIVSVEIRMVQNGEAVTAAGHYEDQYRRVGSGSGSSASSLWKFAHRNLILYHQVPHTKGWA